MQRQLILFLLWAAVLSSCAGAGSSTRNESTVEIGGGLRFGLLSPASFGEELLIEQAVKISFNAENYELLFYTQITSADVTIVATLPSGTRLFSIVYDGQTIISEGGDVLGSITPQYLLADLQLAQWPFSAVAGSLAASNTCFTAGSCAFSQNVEQLRRDLANAGVSVISISYDGLPQYQHTTEYRHHQRMYQLRVETLGTTPIAVKP